MTTPNEKKQTPKSKILEVATKLFYDHGYNDTYLEHVAELCGITKPLISYHYGSKVDLARVVAETYAKENKNVIAFKLYKYYHDQKKYDLQVSTAVEIRLTQMLNLVDKNVNRFYVERINANYDCSVPAKEVSVPFYKIHDRQYKLDIDHDRDELTMLARASAGAALSLTFSYLRGDFDCTMEEFLDYAGEVPFKMMNIHPERIQEIIKESKKVIEEIGFSFEPYFKII
ncbi:helix-turn-helix transcriptional regulator [Alkalibacter rhizosphaerae]|uniref:Helix-turn-helix transcriptional regulator n=1 Tax=Alkalibacter rhizosphaerae TaxID=2815577 RepID=A0A975AIU1_9FIRM|nr:TetR/AcrR family transcriptional regulator [Alkalibacter rhizosphaerae]QSX09458.1 helix-turn-helix transcriptional regulator [Alkalibacter rhizosphaerae]